MAKKLSILIPMYNEGEEVVKPLLDSIQIQKNVDFDNIEVIICCDGGKSNVSELLMSIYDFDITFRMCEHRGVSATRNACLDLALGDFVTWCDCDDSFAYIFALSMIFQEMDGDGFDALISAFVEEGRMPDQKVFYMNHDIDYTFCHGKFYRRQYLLDNNIRWFDNCTVHEDHAFNGLAIKNADPNRVKVMPFPIYAWCWNPDSVCRRDKFYILKTYRNMIESNTELVRELLKREKRTEAIQTVTQMVEDSYFSMNTKQWTDVNNKEYRDATEKRFAEYWKEFKELFNEADDQTKYSITASIRQRFYMEGLLFEEITFGDWKKHIEKLEEE